MIGKIERRTCPNSPERYDDRKTSRPVKKASHFKVEGFEREMEARVGRQHGGIES
jgi:hypothetical protein